MSKGNNNIGKTASADDRAASRHYRPKGIALRSPGWKYHPDLTPFGRQMVGNQECNPTYQCNGQSWHILDKRRPPELSHGGNPAPEVCFSGGPWNLVRQLYSALGPLDRAG